MTKDSEEPFVPMAKVVRVILLALIVAFIKNRCLTLTMVGTHSKLLSSPRVAQRPWSREGCVLRTSALAADSTEAATGKLWAVEPFRSVLLGRRTVNAFEATLPAGWEGAVRRAVEVACFAPNHRRTEPWRFYLLGPHRIRAVCELNAQLVSAKKGEAAAAKKLSRWLGIPGWLVVTQKLPNDLDAEGVSGRGGLLEEDYAACCCAVQNLCLSLHAEGLGTKWTTGPVNFDAAFPLAAGVPEGEQVVGTIWFGTPAEQPRPPVKRLAVDDVLHMSD